MLRGCRPTLILLFACLSCDGFEKPKPNQTHRSYDIELPQAANDSPVYQDADLRLEVMKAEPCETHGVLAPARGQIRLVFPIKLEVLSNREVPVGPMLFSLVDDERTYRPTLATCKETFHVGKLKQGEERNAHVAFDLPENVRPTHLVFEPFLVGRKAVVAKARLVE